MWQIASVCHPLAISHLLAATCAQDLQRAGKVSPFSSLQNFIPYLSKKSLAPHPFPGLSETSSPLIFASLLLDEAVLRQTFLTVCNFKGLKRKGMFFLPFLI